MRIGRFRTARTQPELQHTAAIHLTVFDDFLRVVYPGQELPDLYVTRNPLEVQCLNCVEEGAHPLTNGEMFGHIRLLAGADRDLPLMVHRFWQGEWHTTTEAAAHAAALASEAAALYSVAGGGDSWPTA